ncbi:gag-pol polyprotein [Tanacetum coccineum]
MNLLNHNCKTSFVKPEFLKKAQRVNPRMYDIGCYNDNLALMLAPEFDDSIRLAHESRSKLSDLIKPFEYKQLNDLYDLFVPQREKSAEQRFFSEKSKIIYHPQNHPTYYTQNSSSRQQHAATKNRGKAIVTSSTPTYDQAPVMAADDDEMSKEKEIDKLMALISQSFKKIYKPTNNNLRNSSNTSRANQDNTLKIDRGTRYDNQRAVNVAGARANVGTQVVQQSGIQCYNCKEYGHVARECQKPKRAKDAAYHREKMLLCKQEEAGF